jgi:uncharacterized membrane protein
LTEKLENIFGTKSDRSTGGVAIDMNKYRIVIWMMAIVGSVGVLLVFDIRLDDSSIPTVISGLATTIALILGFNATLIGIMWHEVGGRYGVGVAKAIKTRLMMRVLLVTVAMSLLWIAYSILVTFGRSIALRIALSDLLFSICLLTDFLAEVTLDSFIVQTYPDAR